MKLSSETLFNNRHFLVASISLSLIIGAYIFEYLGYLPCELCLIGRQGHYAIIALGALISFLYLIKQQAIIDRLSLVFDLAFIVALVHVIYWSTFHVGVEQKVWSYACGAGGALNDNSLSSGDLLSSLDGAAPLISCSDPSILVFGLSLATWNLIISSFALIIMLVGVYKEFPLFKKN